MISIREKVSALATGVALAIGTFGMVASFSVPAQWAVYDAPSWIENMMTQLRALQSNMNEAQQLANQFKQYQNMIKNSDSLTGGSWNEASDAMGRLADMMEEGQGISVAAGNYDGAFRARFPGYKPQDNYAESYRKWNQTSRDSVLGALKVANMQTQGIQTEQQAINALRAAASSSGGQKAAIDASNQIALAQVDQMQQLRELMVAQLQAQGTYMAAQDQAVAAKAASVTEATRFKSAREGYKAGQIELKRPTE